MFDNLLFKTVRLHRSSLNVTHVTDLEPLPVASVLGEAMDGHSLYRHKGHPVSVSLVTMYCLRPATQYHTQL